MGMAPNRPARTAAIVVAVLAGLVLVVWLSGYLYWQMRISRAIEALKRGPDRYSTELFFADRELLRIGSRGIPRMLGEIDDALLRGDDDLAFVLSCGLSDLVSGAQEVGADAAAAAGSYERTRERPSAEELRANFQEWKEGWPEMREWYSPWWMWWQGHRRRY